MPHNNLWSGSLNLGRCQYNHSTPEFLRNNSWSKILLRPKSLLFPESGSENEDDWEEMEEEQDESSTVCLFCEEYFRNAEGVWKHCVLAHGVDILKITRIHRKLDCCINNLVWHYLFCKVHQCLLGIHVPVYSFVVVFYLFGRTWLLWMYQAHQFH